MEQHRATASVLFWQAVLKGGLLFLILAGLILGTGLPLGAATGPTLSGKLTGPEWRQADPEAKQDFLSQSLSSISRLSFPKLYHQLQCAGFDPRRFVSALGSVLSVCRQRRDPHQPGGQYCPIAVFRLTPGAALIPVERLVCWGQRRRARIWAQLSTVWPDLDRRSQRFWGCRERELLQLGLLRADPHCLAHQSRLEQRQNLQSPQAQATQNQQRPASVGKEAIGSIGCKKNQRIFWAATALVGL
jgi:hypothetical protein